MKLFIRKLILIFFFTSISKFTFSHEFWIDPKKYHLTNNEIAEKETSKNSKRYNNWSNGSSNIIDSTS